MMATNLTFFGTYLVTFTFTVTKHKTTYIFVTQLKRL